MARFPLGCILAAALLTPVRGGLSYPDCTNGRLKSNQVCNASAPADARATALVEAMSNSEKLVNLVKFVSTPLLSMSKSDKRLATRPASPLLALQRINGGTKPSTA